MKFRYKDQIITASSKVEAVNKIRLSKEDKESIFNRAINGDKSVLKLPKKELIIKDDVWGKTPVHYLAEDGIVEILNLPKEVLVIRSTGDWNTPIHLLAIYFSARSGKEIVKLPKELLTIKNKNGNTPIHSLAMNSNKEILSLPKELLMIKNKEGKTPIDILNKRLSKKIIWPRMGE